MWMFWDKNIIALGCGVIKCCDHWKCEDVNGGRRKKRVGKGVMVLFVCLYGLHMLKGLLIRAIYCTCEVDSCAQ